MRSFSKGLFLFALISLISIGPAVMAENEEEKSWSITTQVDFQSAYMFRGQDLFDGTGIQPSITTEYSLGDLGTFGGNVWSHLSADENKSSEERFTEIDYTLYHNIKFDQVTLGGGLVWYTYPADDDITNTQEYFLKLALDTPLSPTVVYYRDFDAVNANFFVLSLSEELTSPSIGEGVSVSPFASGTFVEGADRLYEQDGLAHVTLGTSASFSLGDVGVVPALSYNFKIDDTTVNKLWLTLTLKYDI